MRVAVLSDIHGNIGALRAVINDAQSQGIRNFYCLGDIVGYGPNPKECLGLVREHCELVVGGNHEDMVLNWEGNWDLKLVNHLARAGILHTLKELKLDDISFIKTLPKKVVRAELNLTLAHAAFSEPTWTHIHNENIAVKEMGFLNTKIGFVGHTHVPRIYKLKGESNKSLEFLSRCIINVGSVGQPRDEDPRASYGLLDISENTISYENRRVTYNIGQALKYLENAGLPPSSGTRLLSGL